MKYLFYLFIFSFLLSADTGVMSTSNFSIDTAGYARPVFSKNIEKYFVKTLEDNNKLGSLRYGLELETPLEIVFSISGVIKLKKDIFVKSNKIINNNKKINIFYYGLRLVNVKNIVIKNLNFSDGIKSIKNGDAIEIIGSSDIWIDHCSFSNYADGLIDIKRANPNIESNITVSWSYFKNHNKVMLIGLHIESKKFNEKNLFVTLHHNFFDGTNQRHPRLTKGVVHFYNNIIKWNYYGLAIYDDGFMLIENNYFLSTGKSIKSLQYKHPKKNITDGNFYLKDNKYMGSVNKVKNYTSVQKYNPLYRSKNFIQNKIDLISIETFNKIKDESGSI